MPPGPSTVCVQSPDGPRPASTMMMMARRSLTASCRVRRPYQGAIWCIGQQAHDGEAGKSEVVDQAAIEQLHIAHRAVAIPRQGIGKGLQHRRRVRIALHTLYPCGGLVGAILRIGLYDGGANTTGTAADAATASASGYEARSLHSAVNAADPNTKAVRL